MPSKIPPSPLRAILALVLPLTLGQADAAQSVELVETASTGNSASVDRPAIRPRHLVIFLHGHRGTGSVMATIGRSWQSDLVDTVFVAPDAPLRHRSGGREWFAVDDQVLRPERIQAARRAFDSSIREIVKDQGFENDLANVAFVGVSQGAIMALDAVASGRWQVGALVSFAGLLPLPPSAGSGNRTVVLLMHGSADRTIPSEASISAASELEAAGFDVSLNIVQGVGHTISPEEAKTALQFLARTFGS